MSKFVSFLKAHVVGPVSAAVGATVASVSATGKFDPKEAALVFVGALVGAIVHKQVIVRVVGES